MRHLVRDVSRVLALFSFTASVAENSWGGSFDFWGETSPPKRCLDKTLPSTWSPAWFALPLMTSRTFVHASLALFRVSTFHTRDGGTNTAGDRISVCGLPGAYQAVHAPQQRLASLLKKM